MSLIKVPIFNKTNDSNGTLYNFMQHNNDLTKSLSNVNTFKRVPSKFVCIKLPKWKNMSGRHMFMQPDDISPNVATQDPNILFPKLLQNYAENMYAYSIKEEVRSDATLEWGFWKLMHKLGAVNLIDDPSVRSLISDSLVTGNDTFVKYVGDINVLNYVEYGNRVYSETYLHIPHDARPLQTNTWRTDANLSRIARLPQLENGTNASLGLEISATEINNAVYDADEAQNSLNYYDLSTTVSKARLSIDSMTSAETFDDFDFNAILIYYDTYDIDTDGNKSNYSTKLGGLFLVDKFVLDSASNSWEIPVVTKYNNAVNNAVTGNSIAYRLCANFFHSGEQAVIDTVVNEHNTVALDLYVHALQQMLKTGDIFKESYANIDLIAEKLSTFNYGSDIAAKLLQNSAVLNELNDKVNTIIGASGYTVTNMQLLDAFAKLSNDLRGSNGSNIVNNFIFGQGSSNTGNNSLSFNLLYTYIHNGKYSIRYSDTSMLDIGFIQNKILSDYTIAADADGSMLKLTLVAGNDMIKYAVNGVMYNNAAPNQQILMTFAVNNNAKPYVLTLNKTNGKFEVFSYTDIQKTALENYAYVASFILPTADNYAEFGINFVFPSYAATTTNQINVQLGDERQGLYKTGDVIPAGTSIETIVANMLTNESALTYKAPVVKIELQNIDNLTSSTASLTEFKVNYDVNDGGSVSDTSLTSTPFDVQLKVDTANKLLKIGDTEVSYDANDNQIAADSINVEHVSNTSFILNLPIFNVTNVTATGHTGLTNNITSITVNHVANNEVTLNLNMNVSTTEFIFNNSYFIPAALLGSSIALTAIVTYDEGVVKFYQNGSVIPGHIQAGSASDVLLLEPSATMSFIFATPTATLPTELTNFDSSSSTTKKLLLNISKLDAKYIHVAISDESLSHDIDTAMFTTQSNAEQSSIAHLFLNNVTKHDIYGVRYKVRTAILQSAFIQNVDIAVTLK